MEDIGGFFVLVSKVEEEGEGSWEEVECEGLRVEEV